MRKILSLALALCLCAAMMAVAVAEANGELLTRLNGTYISLFPEYVREEYRDYWMECIGAYGIEGEAAEATYAALTQGFMGTLKGQAAVDAYGSDPTSMVFDCYLENGLEKITIDGNMISGVDSEGNEVFHHAYHYVEDVDVTFLAQRTGTQMHLYVADDPDAGIFTYFAFTDDTIADTCHIEFRYGETSDNIGDFSEGQYAFWLVGAINEGYEDSQIQGGIKLFVDENLGEEASEVIEIATAEALAAIDDNLSGHYVLTADIDLSGIEWTPIGAYTPSGESEEEQEIPAADAAFTGTFDGQGYTISNLTINQPEGWAMGLFGCIANADVGNFTLVNATVDAQLMGSDVVGYAYCSTVHDIALLNGKVTAHASEMSGEGMYGGIVGAGMGSVISGCTAQVEIVLPDNTANAGIVGGGLELTSVVNCAATGSISAGDNCYGLGGVSGCGFVAQEFTGDTAEDVTITCGNNCFWIGGITGYAGGFEGEEVGVPVTAVTACKALNVAVTTGENPDGVSAIVGAGFYNEAVAEAMGTPFDQPTAFILTDCVAENVTVNGVTAA